jgi:SpoVK/Ycf46/Vps4 family AAA+-type ATPase
MSTAATLSIFDKQTPLPDGSLTEQEKHLLGFEARYQRVRGQLHLLMHLDDLEGWGRRHYGKAVKITKFVGEQYPLVVFHGDVGTGKTVTAESVANRLVLDDENADDSLLYKLSTRVRGSGKVGEMGTLINQAFKEVVAGAGKSRRAFLIIDEGDSLAAKRSQEYSHHEDKVAVNTLIQNIDDLRQYRGRIVVILCTNRLSVLDPAILRRAAIKEAFNRPNGDERLELFRNDLSDLGLTDDDLLKLVAATGVVMYTYSDIRQMLYPAAVAKALPNKLTLDNLLEAIHETAPSPVVEDA